MNVNAEKQRRFRERKQAAGWTRLTLWIQADRKADLENFAAALRNGQSPGQPSLPAGQTSPLATEKESPR
jgi:hypothetical protein